MGIDDVFSGDMGSGVLFGLGALVLAPIAGRIIRPVAKAAIKGGMTIYRDTGIADATQDLVAEARAELEQGRSEREGREEGQQARRAKTPEPKPA